LSPPVNKENRLLRRDTVWTGNMCRRIRRTERPWS